MRQMSSLEVSAAAATPITGDGRCHRPLYLAHLRGLLDRGCDAVVLFGTTGEGPAFSVAERCAVLDDVLAAGLPADRLVLAAMSAAPADCLALCRHALAHGVHRLLVMPPFFFRGAARPAGLERFYGDLIEALGASELRLLLYHFPEMSGATMDAAFMDRLRRRYDTVIDGLKDSTGDLPRTLGLIRDLPGLRVLVGTEVQLPQAVAAGGAGTICGLANAAPEIVRAITHATAPGEIAELAAKLDAIEAGFGGVPFVVGLKHFLAEATGAPEWAQPMPPLTAK